jgi:hypothetical protein
MLIGQLLVTGIRKYEVRLAVNGSPFTTLTGDGYVVYRIEGLVNTCAQGFEAGATDVEQLTRTLTLLFRFSLYSLKCGFDFRD